MTSIAVLIPCLNEEASITKVVEDFRRELPEADIYVYDNGSTDRTVDRASAVGAIVRYEPRRGKGRVVRTMLEEIEADYYVMVDGDDTYPAEYVHTLLEPVQAGEADMVVGSRMISVGSQFNKLNRLGNVFFLHLVNLCFGVRLTDILSGYRAMTRKFAKTIPILASGFEIETELTIRSLLNNYRIVEVPSPLRPRGENSQSKIRFLGDGLSILWAILTLVRDYKPLTVFGSLGLALSIGGAIWGVRTCLVFNSSIISEALLSLFISGIFIALGFCFVAVGMTLNTINNRFNESLNSQRLLYCQLSTDLRQEPLSTSADQR